MFADQAVANTKAVKLQHRHHLARGRNTIEHAAERFGQLGLAAMRAGHDHFAHHAVSFGDALLNGVMKIGEHRVERFKHRLHARAASLALVIQRVFGVTRGSGNGVLPVVALGNQTLNQLLVGFQ